MSPYRSSIDLGNDGLILLAQRASQSSELDDVFNSGIE
jgi:hypothetical protein